MTNEEINRYIHVEIMGMVNRRTTRPASPMPIRFWEKAELTADATRCWNWRAARDKRGYGRFNVNGKPRTASIVAFVIANNRLPVADVRHVCDNPACVNPAHLIEGTHQDNMDDRQARGRTARGSSITRAVLNEAQVVQIKSMLSAVSNIDLSRRFGVDPSVISKIRHGKLWRHV